MEYLQSYQKVMSDRVLQAKPEEVMVMVYEGMLTKIKQAIERFQSGEKFPAREAVIRVMQMVDALCENLNFEGEGEEIAKNLESLYYYLTMELSRSIRAEEPAAHLKNCLRVIEVLHEGWKGLAEKTA